MKLSYQKFCSSPPVTFRAILFSSFESELLRDPLTKQLHSYFLDAQIQRYPAADRLSDPFSLLETLRSPTLFGPPPKIIIDDVTPSQLPVLKKLIEDLLPTDRLILTTSYLKASAALRVFFETTSEVYFIPIYSPTETQTQQLIAQFFKNFGHRPTDELLSHLSQVYGKSTQLFESELTPFCLLFPSPETITLSQYMHYAQALSPDEVALVKAFLLREGLLTQPPQFSSSIGFLRLLSFHVQRLLEQKGHAPNSAIKATLDMKPIYDKALTLWSLTDLKEAIRKLQKLEVKCKSQNLDGSSEIFYELFPIFSSR